MDIIKALKENEKPFGLMSEEMQEEASRIGKGKFQRYQYSAGGFIQVAGNYDGSFSADSTYRLRPDYAPEPEIVECEVKSYKEYGSSLRYKEPQGQAPYELYMATCHPDFIGFKYEDGLIDTSPRVYETTDGETVCHLNCTFATENFKVLTPTHVLFRSTK